MFNLICFDVLRKRVDNMQVRLREVPELALLSFSDRPKIGWFCGYTPVEVLLAAGFTPVRVKGHTSSVGKADSCLHANMCHYVRSALDAALKGFYDDLKGAVFVNSCDAMRRLYDVWRKHVNMDFTFLLDLPRGQSEEDVTYYQNEILKLRNAFAVSFGIDITNKQIKAAAQIYSEGRDQYKALNDLRRETPPRISGYDIANMAAFFSSTSPEKWDAAALTLTTEKSEQSAPAVKRLRMVLDGSPVHNPEVIGFIEDCGFDVVAENFCSGSRLFDLNTANSNTGDILNDLSAAYLNKPPCARMMRFEDRAARLIDMVKDFSAHGVIHISLKFCDTYLYDVPRLRKKLASAGIKSLFLETDGTIGSIGQLKTRIEAFAEMIGGDVL